MSDFNTEEAKEDYMTNHEAYDSDEENEGFSRQEYNVHKVNNQKIDINKQ